MLCWHADEEIVRLLGEGAAPALLHDAGIPRVLDAFLDSQLYEEVQGVGPILPKQIKSS